MSFEVLEAQLVEARDRIRQLEREAEIREQATLALQADLDLANAACRELRGRLRAGGAS